MPRSQSFLLSLRLPLPRPATSTWQRIWRLQRKTRVTQNRPRFTDHGRVVGMRGRLSAPPALLTGLDRALTGVKRHISAVGKLKIHAAPGGNPSCLALGQAIDNTDYSCHAAQRRGRTCASWRCAFWRHAFRQERAPKRLRAGDGLTGIGLSTIRGAFILTSSIDPIPLFLIAEQYRRASHYLVESAHQGCIREVTMPAAVCAAFALELYFKTLVALDSGQAAKIHDLRALFDKLAISRQQRIRDLFQPHLPKAQRYWMRRAKTHLAPPLSTSTGF